VFACLGHTGRRKLTGRPGVFFSYRLKAFAAECALLLQMFTDGDQLGIAHALLEPLSIHIGSSLRHESHLEEAGRRRDERVVAQKQVGVNA
jgi:hypothetical protein